MNIAAAGCATGVLAGRKQGLKGMVSDVRRMTFDMCRVTCDVRRVTCDVRRVTVSLQGPTVGDMMCALERVSQAYQQRNRMVRIAARDLSSCDHHATIRVIYSAGVILRERRGVRRERAQPATGCCT